MSATPPNFFIIGAPKCGTTALAQYLSEHPNVFMCAPKEPHFFASDYPTRHSVSTRAEYDRLFAGVTPNHLAVGEASVHYLRSQHAVPTIIKENRSARFIVMLRNPTEFMPSWFGQQRFNLEEDVESFNEAWALSEERRAGRSTGPRCTDPTFLDYKSIALFGEQCERLLSHVPREQVMFIRFEEFKSDTPGVYRRVLAFLGVPDDQRDQFEKINARRDVRSRWLWGVLKSTYRKSKRFRLNEKLRALPLATPAWRKLQDAIFHEIAPPKLSPDIEAQIREHYADDVRRLAGLTGWDLSNWLSPDQPQDPSATSEAG